LSAQLYFRKATCPDHRVVARINIVQKGFSGVKTGRLWKEELLLVIAGKRNGGMAGFAGRGFIVRSLQKIADAVLHIPSAKKIEQWQTAPHGWPKL
jgi:hypothetical protein